MILSDTWKIVSTLIVALIFSAWYGLFFVDKEQKSQPQTELNSAEQVVGLIEKPKNLNLKKGGVM